MIRTLPGGVPGDTGVSVCTEAELSPLSPFPVEDELLELLLLPLHLGTTLIKADGGFDSQATVISDSGVPAGSGLQCSLGGANSTFKSLRGS